SHQQQQIIPLNSGDLWTTLGALFFSFQVLLIDHFGKTLRSSAFTPGMFVTAAIVSAMIFAVSQSMTSLEYDSIGLRNWLALFSMPGFMGVVLFLAIFCSLLAFLGMNTYQPSISAAQASVIYSLEPLFASLWAMLVPGLLAGFLTLEYQNESLTVHLMVGGFLILVANIVALWPRSERGSSKP
ncbi:MAG: DMT family transporter, partial [Planctomycetes bacterium]|nr:DMT family transporter [Planctomycetota bacterium]